MSRFFTNEIAPDGSSARITGEDVRHISKVLRLRIGDVVELCDGACMEYQGKISSITPDVVTLELADAHTSPAEAEHRVTLFQGLPKAGKLETIIQKCTELGIDTVVPVEMERCVVVAKDFSKKLERYQRVAEEAAKQSRRGMIPSVKDAVSLKKVDFSCFDTVLVPYEGEQEMTLKTALQNGVGKRIAVIIGPEGGFEQEEVAYLQKQGGIPVTLGSRILRTETAGMAVLAQILYELE